MYMVFENTNKQVIFRYIFIFNKINTKECAVTAIFSLRPDSQWIHSPTREGSQEFVYRQV